MEYIRSPINSVAQPILYVK